MGARGAHRQARARLGDGERLEQQRVLGQDGLGLEAVGAVVAVEHDHRAALRRALDVALEQVVRLLLGLGQLHRLDELRVVVLLRGAGGAALDHGLERVPELREIVVPARVQAR